MLKKLALIAFFICLIHLPLFAADSSYMDATEFVVGTSGIKYTGGKLGIGTTSPTVELEVSGDMRAKSYSFVVQNYAGTNGSAIGTSLAVFPGLTTSGITVTKTTLALITYQVSVGVNSGSTYNQKYVVSQLKYSTDNSTFSDLTGLGAPKAADISGLVTNANTRASVVVTLTPGSTYYFRVECQSGAASGATYDNTQAGQQATMTILLFGNNT
ncbi:MAG: hypothetical protein AB7F28_05015 [Candidatus Margulisiibacteriota bacterium]